MNNKIALLPVLVVLLSCWLGTISNMIEVDAYDGYPAHNLDTGLNYSTIQEAIDAPETLNGHTILVGDGVYLEHVRVSKAISLIGEGLNATIIDGGIYINVSDVRISNFTIRNSIGTEQVPNCGILLVNSTDTNISGNLVTNNSGAGTYLIESDNCTISQNILVNNGYDSVYQVAGIMISRSDGNQVRQNRLTDNRYGIYVDRANKTRINGNSLVDNGYGIYLYSSFNNSVTENTVSNSSLGGMHMRHSAYNQFLNNVISNSTWANFGIYASRSCIVANNTLSNGYYGIRILREVPNPPIFDANILYYNRFENNTIQAYVEESVNFWDNGAEGNYWSDYQGQDSDEDDIGDAPYVINENNQDNHPLMVNYNPQETQVSRKIFDKLVEKYIGLLTNYNEMYGAYKDLNNTYDDLSLLYHDLNTTYNKLKSEQEATLAELNNVRNTMNIFVGATLVLAGTTATLAVMVYRKKTISK